MSLEEVRRPVSSGTNSTRTLAPRLHAQTPQELDIRGGQPICFWFWISAPEWRRHGAEQAANPDQPQDPKERNYQGAREIHLGAEHAFSLPAHGPYLDVIYTYNSITLTLFLVR